MASSDREMAVVIAKIVMNQGHSAVHDSVKKKASPLSTRPDYGSRTAGLSDVELAVLRILHHSPGQESWQVKKILKGLSPQWAKVLGDVDVRGVNLKRVMRDLEDHGLIEDADQGGIDFRGQMQEWYPIYLTSKGEAVVRQHGVRAV